jgi:hypothetical protein
VVTGTTTGPLVLSVAVPFAWWGAVVAISVLETPLKFRAPGITVPLGLGIGRLVFRALNGLEAVLAGAIAVGLSTADPTPQASAWAWGLFGALVATLLGQVLILRPALDRRAQAIVDGHPVPPSRLHLTYVAGEAFKLLALPALAVVVAAGLSS